MNRDYNRTLASPCKSKGVKRKERRQNKNKRSKTFRFTHRNLGYSFSDKKRIMDIFDRKTVPTWYWSNYYKAKEWHYKSKVTLWKSYAFALQEENKYLLDLLCEKKSNVSLDIPFTLKNLHYCDKLWGNNQKFNKDRCRKWQNVQNTAVTSCDSKDSKEVTFEISEEMIKFFEQSIKHKLDLKKSKEVSEEVKTQVKDIQDVHYQRSEEVSLLYGEASSMIAGMETAVQLSYDKYCDLKSPKYWPNIPLNL